MILKELLKQIPNWFTASILGLGACMGFLVFGALLQSIFEFPAFPLKIFIVGFSIMFGIIVFVLAKNTPNDKPQRFTE